MHHHKVRHNSLIRLKIRVVQQTLQDIGREGQIQQNKLAGNAVASGAFGGSRFGVAQAETAKNTMEQQARAAGQLRQQGFSQAQRAQRKQRSFKVH